MIDGDAVTARLEERRRAGASGEELLHEAVVLIEEAEEKYDWVGIYLLEEDTLALHDYVGKHTDHTRIRVGEGVCGTAVAEDRDLNIEDVNEIENYLACSLETVSELVVLIREPGSGRVLGQLDLDSDRRAAFGERDERELRKVAAWLGGTLQPPA